MEIKRNIESTLLEYLNIFPAVGILGPRQVGKTTLSKSLSKSRQIHYLDLESAADRLKLSNIALYLESYADKIVVFDEVQQMPEIFAELRGIIDSNRKNGRFILLGSASPTMIKKSADSLAGRIGYIELSAFLTNEIEEENENKLWNRGGFPLSYLASSDKASLIWRKNFIRTYVEKDLGLLGFGAETQTIERFWRMLANTNANLWNAENIGRSMGLSATTINRYLDYMEGAFLIRRLQPYSANIAKRLVKSPKIYLRDTGILHAFKEINTFEQLINDPQVGASWEGFVVEQIISSLENKAQAFFYRTQQGAECDLIIEQNGRVLAAIEIKLSAAPTIRKGFRIAKEDLKAGKGFVIGKVNESYRLDKEITVTNLNDFINNQIKKIIGD
jgi:uncharacterized protein